MKALRTPLTPATDKVSERDHDRIYKLYESKKHLVTLDGKPRTIISRLSSKFPVVSIAGTGEGVEFAASTVERILNGDCKFRS